VGSATPYGNDANESTNVAAANPEILTKLQARLAALEATLWKHPPNAPNTGAACAVAATNGGVFAPWQ
jgi:hypothetical protein